MLKLKKDRDFIPTIENVDFNRDYIFTTDGLNKFGVDAGNRKSEEDESTVTSYYKVMMDGKWFFELSPIWVGINSKTIFNGEHRRKAIMRCKSKGVEFDEIHVRFVDDSNLSKEKRKALNTGKHWNCDDYVNSLISIGNKSFKELYDFCVDENHVQLHSTKGKPHYNKGAIVLGLTYNQFKDAYLSGEWDLEPKEIRTSEKRYYELVRLKKAFDYEDVGQDCWIQIGDAWHKFMYDTDSYSSRIDKLPNKFESFIEAIRHVDNSNSNKTSVWFNRLVNALEYAETH